MKGSRGISIGFGSSGGLGLITLGRSLGCRVLNLRAGPYTRIKWGIGIEEDGRTEDDTSDQIGNIQIKIKSFYQPSGVTFVSRVSSVSGGSGMGGNLSRQAGRSLAVLLLAALAASCGPQAAKLSVRSSPPNTTAEFSVTSSSEWSNLGSTIAQQEVSAKTSAYPLRPGGPPMTPIRTQPVNLHVGNGTYDLMAGPMPAGFSVPVAGQIGRAPGMYFPRDLRQANANISFGVDGLLRTTLVDGQLYVVVPIHVNGLPAPYPNFSIWLF